jgi:hypothetical protein
MLLILHGHILLHLLEGTRAEHLGCRVLGMRTSTSALQCCTATLKMSRWLLGTQAKK